MSLAAQLSVGAATLDDAGRLWLVDDATGDLTRVADGKSTVHRGVAHPGKDLMALVDGKPVVVDAAGRKAVLVDPDDGSPAGSLDLDLRPSDTIAVSGSPHANRLYVVASRGVLDICDLSARSCSGAVALDSDGNDLGAAVETGDRVFVPDYTTGQVWVVDLTGHTVVATAQVLGPATRFQLLTRDGIVFFNDPNSEKAGVINLDGVVTQVAKYDPADPAKGLPGHRAPVSAPPSLPASKPSAPPTSQSQPKPSTPPSQPPPSRSTPSQPSRSQSSSPPVPTTRPRPTGPTSPTSSPPPAIPAPSRTPTATPSPTPTTPSSPSSSSKPPATLSITLSNANLKFGQTETLSVKADDGTAVSSAHWTYGDNQAGDGATVSHVWARPAGAAQQTFQVTVAAVLADGRRAQTAMSLTVNHPDTATVPNVVHQDQAAAKQAIATAGLTTGIVTGVFNNSVPAGQVLTQSPVSGGTVPWGSAVALTVSSGPAPAWSMVAHACDSASWSSGAGALRCPGGDTDDTGFALVRTDCWVFTDESTQCDFLETHPQWVDNGSIHGVYNLPRPIIAGDHFRADLGFMKPKTGQSPAIVNFRLIVAGQIVGDWDLKSADDRMVQPDVDLSSFAGVQQVTLEVDAHGSVGQCWASWVNASFGP